MDPMFITQEWLRIWVGLMMLSTLAVGVVSYEEVPPWWWVIPGMLMGTILVGFTRLGWFVLVGA